MDDRDYDVQLTLTKKRTQQPPLFEYQVFPVVPGSPAAKGSGPGPRPSPSPARSKGGSGPGPRLVCGLGPGLG